MTTSSLIPRPAVAAAQPHPFPSCQYRQLSNGVTIWAFDLPGQHLLSAQLVVTTPLAVEPMTIEGVTSLIMDTITDGTVDHPGPSFAEALDDQGAALDGRVTHSASMLALTVPVTRFERGLGLLAEAAQQAALTDEDVQRSIEIRRSEIAQELINPTHAVERGFKQAVYAADDRQARPSGGTLANMDAMTPAAVRAEYQRLWRPQQATLILAGALPADVDALIDEHFGSWPVNDTRLAVSQPKLNSGRRIFIVDRPDAPQAQIRIGGPGLDRSHPNWSATQLAVQAIGGGFLSRVNRVLREQRGYTYGAHVTMSPLTHAGSYALRGSFRTEIAVEAITAALELLDVRSDPLAVEDVIDARNYLLGVGPLQRQTAGQIASQAAALASVGLPTQWIDENQRTIATVSVDQANQALAALIDPAACHIVIAGDAGALMEPLRDAGLIAEVLELVG